MCCCGMMMLIPPDMIGIPSASLRERTNNRADNTVLTKSDPSPPRSGGEGWVRGWRSRVRSGHAEFYSLITRPLTLALSPHHEERGQIGSKPHMPSAHQLT